MKHHKPNNQLNVMKENFFQQIGILIRSTCVPLLVEYTVVPLLLRGRFYIHKQKITEAKDINLISRYIVPSMNNLNLANGSMKPQRTNFLTSRTNLKPMVNFLSDVMTKETTSHYKFSKF